jgi:hypothetical protein
MTHRVIRIAVALTTFLAGIAFVWFSNLLVPLEVRLADWLVPTHEVTLRAVPFVSREDADAQEIYETIINQMFTYNDTQMVVTMSKLGSYKPYYIINDFGLGPEPETLCDYGAKNNEPEKPFPLLNLAIPQVRLDRQEFQMLFEQNHFDGWKNFYERYPNSTGFLDFSRIGFNRAGDEAFVYASKSCGGLCGEGWYILLRKTSDGWMIQNKKMVWVS